MERVDINYAAVYNQLDFKVICLYVAKLTNMLHCRTI